VFRLPVLKDGLSLLDRDEPATGYGRLTALSGLTPAGIFSAIVLMSLLQQPVWADSKNRNQWGLCGTPTTEFIKTPKFKLRDTPMDLSADQARVDRAGTSVMAGNVSVRRNGQSVRADEARYNEQEQYVEVNGNVVYSDPNWTVEAPAGEYDLDLDQFELSDADFWFPSRHGRGAADQVLRHGDGLVELDEARYTTCEENDEFWVLSAEHLKLDGDSGVGTARDVVLKLKGVPILYTPYMTFPLDDRRKSGFLAPSIGSSSESGADVAVPYYFNIAPDKDLTFTPRVLAKRGLQLGGVGRYLGSATESILGLDYLHDDQFGSDRYAYALDHEQSWLDGLLRADLNINQVSDREYLDDLSDSLSVASTTHLERRGDLRLDSRRWDLLARLQDYQTLDRDILPEDRPYERVPQLVADGRYDRQPLGFGYGFHSEFTRFQHDDNVEGNRYDVSLALNRPIEGPGYFVRPKVEVEHTGYDLDNAAPDTDDSPTRTLPVASLDSGLVFERSGQRWLQTVEPRLYYLYIPFEKQDDLPVFDTGVYDFNFAQLFRDDRFNGVDRVGDANQITAAVTSRLIDEQTGRETLSGSLGQIYYFDDPEVELPDFPIESDNHSDFVGELVWRLTEAFSTRGTVLWDPHDDALEREIAQLRYRGDDNKILNLSYRRRRDIDLKQTDLAFAWPLNPSWRVVGRLNYDLSAGQDLESFAGFEYESCCFTIRMLGRRYVNDEEDEHNNSVYFQLVLKGLTSLGSSVGDRLEEGILGYEDAYH
jgi:LPS-assembly protein